MGFSLDLVPQAVADGVNTVVMGIDNLRQDLSGLFVPLIGVEPEFFISVLTAFMDNDLFKLPNERNTIFDTPRPFLAGFDVEAFFFK